MPVKRPVQTPSIQLKDVFQIGNEILIPALCLARAVGNLRNRRPVAVGHLDHDVHRFHPRYVAGQPGANAEAHIDPIMQRPV